MFEALTVLAALLLAASSVITPILVQRNANTARQVERTEDFKRQDAVVAKTEEAAKLLLAANAATVKTTKMTNEKLDVIHVLVNSNMTASMQEALNSTVRELALMKEVIKLNRKNEIEPSDEALAALTATETRISELRTRLEERIAQQKEINDSLKKGKSAPAGPTPETAA